MIPLFEHNVCNEIAMQGIGAHKKGFLAAMWLECYVLLHYFERARGTKGGFWSQGSMEHRKRSSTVPRFCLGKTEVCCVLATDWRHNLPSSKVI